MAELLSDARAGKITPKPKPQIGSSQSNHLSKKAKGRNCSSRRFAGDSNHGNFRLQGFEVGLQSPLRYLIRETTRCLWLSDPGAILPLIRRTLCVSGRRD